MPTTTNVLSDLHHEFRGSGPPVLFISGASGDAGHFTRTAERLADEFTTVAYDRRGCSRSARLPEGDPISIAGQADDAAALIEELGLAPAIVFGTSAGGIVALEMVARQPSVLRAAIIHEPDLVAVKPDAEAEAEELKPLLELAARNPRAAMEAFARMYTSDATFEGLDPQLRERALANAAHFFTAELEPFASYVPDVMRIRVTGVPLRLLASRDGLPGEEDPKAWLPKQLDLPVSLVSGHHAPYLQQPEVFAEELRPILRELV